MSWNIRCANRPPADRHGELAAVGEVEHGLTSSDMLLLEEHFLARTMMGSPLVNTTLRRAQQRLAEVVSVPGAVARPES
jgi:hypothetical protein